MRFSGYSAIILGGGPAGCAAGIRLAAMGKSVAILERSQYDDQRVGELLPPTANILLHRLSAANICLPHMASPGIVSQWGESKPYEQDFIFNSYGNGWHLDRRLFDASLAKLARDTGAVMYFKASVLSCTMANGRWRVEVVIDGLRGHLTATFLIDATGRTRWFVKRTGARPIVRDRLVAMLCDYRLPKGWKGDHRMGLESDENGWWYSAALPGERLTVAYLTDADLRPPRDQHGGFVNRYFQRSVRPRLELPNLEPFSCRVVSAASYCMDRVAGPGWAAVGDAAMCWDPLSGNGITKALESGIRVADTVVGGENSDSTALDGYANWTFHQFNAYQRTCREYYAVERRWPASLFWRRRQQPIST